MSEAIIICPRCQNPMEIIGTEPSYDHTKKIAYTRTRYRCQQDDTWGRIEIPVGPMEEADVKRLQAAGK